MLRISQQDPRWAQIKIPPSNLSIGRYGCTTTAICMIRSKIYPDETLMPNDAVNLFKYTQDGLIKWGQSDYKGLTFVGRFYGNDPATIRKYADGAGLGVILEVNHSHWVAVRGWSVFGSPVIHDPWDGSIYYFWPKKYTITGYALFQKTT